MRYTSIPIIVIYLIDSVSKKLILSMSLTRTLMSSSQNKFILIKILDRYLKNYYVEVKTFMQHIKRVLCFTVYFIWQTWMIDAKQGSHQLISNSLKIICKYLAKFYLLNIEFFNLTVVIHQRYRYGVYTTLSLHNIF